ncbi:unnamed protein product [Pylaiella littoralis]
MSVTWVLNADSKHEISSKEHLLQLMHKGALYTDAGSPPSDYLAAAYLQTADIDLADDHADIVPIDVFAGEYDGGLHTISNWSYTDPDLTNATVANAGLFGSTSGCVLKHIRLSGKWTLRGFENNSGMLVGRLDSSSQVFDVEGDFAIGSLIDGMTGIEGGTASMIGKAGSSSMTGVTVRGTMDLASVNAGVKGGVIGKTTHQCTFDMITNFATFPNGIQGGHAGGVVGYIRDGAGTTRCLNAMIGDIIGSSYSGGICSFISQEASTLTHSLINAMTGNVTCTNGSGGAAGGIVAQLGGNNISGTQFANYMTGNVSSIDSSLEGGIVGQVTGASTVSASINAMNGSVTNSVLGTTDTGDSSGVQVLVDTSFGLSCDNNTVGVSADAPAGFSTDPAFPDLPYVDVGGTDTDGNTYVHDFVFANLAGHSSFSGYTHASLSLGADHVSSPFFTTFSTVPATTLTFSNLGDRTMFTDGSLVVTSSDADVVYDHGGSTVMYQAVLALSPGAINAKVTISDTPGASTTYRLTYEGEGETDTETTAYANFTSLNRNIRSLDPETVYTVRWYSRDDTESEYALLAEKTTRTLSNVATSYKPADFLEDGKYVLDSLDEDSRDDLASVMNEVFATGDRVGIRLGGISSPQLEADFVNRGGSFDVSHSEALLLPFDESAGAAQTVNLVDEESGTTVAVSYDETANTVGVGSAVYGPGDSFIVGGKRVSVVEF